MTKLLRLQVLTPAESLLEAEDVSWVQARLADGCGIGIYPGHAPLLAETVDAPLRYADEAGEHNFEVEAGILQIDDDNAVTVLTSGASRASSESSTIPTVAEDTEEREFHRLAEELLNRLEHWPEDILDFYDAG
jgi:F0F1-type ATP synthase epsilon subunit